MTSSKQCEPSATTSKRRPSAEVRCPNITLVDTRAPPSRQICTTALSTANPLLPRTFICCTLLGGGQGRQEDSHTGRSEQTGGKGKRRRRSNKTRNCSASIRLTRFVGMGVKGTHDNGPRCDLTITLSAGVSCGHTTCSRWWDCTETDACFCHPRASEGSFSSSALFSTKNWNSREATLFGHSPWRESSLTISIVLLSSSATAPS